MPIISTPSSSSPLRFFLRLFFSLKRCDNDVRIDPFPDSTFSPDSAAAACSASSFASAYNFFLLLSANFNRINLITLNNISTPFARITTNDSSTAMGESSASSYITNPDHMVSHGTINELTSSCASTL